MRFHFIITAVSFIIRKIPDLFERGKSNMLFKEKQSY